MFKKMSDRDYFALDALNNSTLSDINRSVRFMEYRKNNKTEPTASMQIGSLVHCLLLNPEDFDDLFIIMPKINKRTKEGKEEFQNILNQAEAKQLALVEQSQVDQAIDIAASVRSNRIAAQLLDDLQHAEVVGLFQIDGIDCKAKFDGITSTQLIVDVKTTQDASPEAFAKSVATFGYHRQDAFYSKAYEAVTGEKPSAFVFICVENKAPYSTAVYVLDDEAKELGEKEINALVKKYQEYKSGLYIQDYSSKIETLTLPAWYVRSKQDD